MKNNKILEIFKFRDWDIVAGSLLGLSCLCFLLAGTVSWNKEWWRIAGLVGIGVLFLAMFVYVRLNYIRLNSLSNNYGGDASNEEE